MVDSVDEFLDEGQGTERPFSKHTTGEIHDLIEVGERWLLVNEGGFYYGDDKGLPERGDSTVSGGRDPAAGVVQDVQDQLWQLQEELAVRQGQVRELSDLREWFGDHVEWAEGLQKAVDDLKAHTHAGSGEPPVTEL